MQTVLDQIDVSNYENIHFIGKSLHRAIYDATVIDTSLLSKNQVLDKIKNPLGI